MFTRTSPRSSDPSTNTTSHLSFLDISSDSREIWLTGDLNEFTSTQRSIPQLVNFDFLRLTIQETGVGRIGELKLEREESLTTRIKVHREKNIQRIHDTYRL